MKINTPIHTGRLYIRDYKISDADKFFKYLSDSRISEFFECNVNTTLKSVELFIADIISSYSSMGSQRFCISDTSNQMVGSVSLFKVKGDRDTIELGYWLGAEHWNKGYMTEVLKEVIREIYKSKKIEKVMIRLYPDNEASLRLAEKLGFKFYGDTNKDGDIMIMYLILSQLYGGSRGVI